MTTIMKLQRALLTPGLTALALACGAISAQADDAATWSALAAGGKVVLMRHASVQEGKGFGNSLVRDPSCRKERNLSGPGKDEARAIGERFRAHNVPIHDVRHSPYCRTADTAKLAFDRGTAVDYLSLLEVLPPDQAAAQSAQLAEVIGTYSGSGTLVLITHEPNINAISFEIMGKGDFLVLQPMGGSDFEEIGVIR